MAVSTHRTLLAGGYTNEVWKVRVGRDLLIEKRYSDHPPEPNPMYPNLPDHEAIALAHLAGTGLVPELVSYTPATGHEGALLMYRYVAGTQWRRGVADVAALLHAVHSAPAPRDMRRLHQSAVEARDRADEVIADVPLPAERARLTECRPTDAADQPLRRPALVHTDCGPGNLVRSRHGLVLIDWQCPGVGDPVEDLACFLSPAMMVLYAAPPPRRCRGAAIPHRLRLRRCRDRRAVPARRCGLALPHCRVLPVAQPSPGRVTAGGGGPVPSGTDGRAGVAEDMATLTTE